MVDIARIAGEAESLRYLHWPRKLTVLSGVAVGQNGETIYHVSVTRWGHYKPERADDHDCQFAVEHFGGKWDAVEEARSRAGIARGFYWAEAEQ